MHQYLLQGDNIIGTQRTIAAGCTNTCQGSGSITGTLRILLAALLPAVASNIIGILTIVAVALIAVAMVIVVLS